MKRRAPTVIRGRLGALVKACGGVDAFAALCDVSAVTVWRWGTKQMTPRRRARARINDMARVRRLRQPYPGAQRFIG
jgi:hypothetical protein